ncbi:glycosyltransferase family 2 protein [Kaistella carnis]|uniref:glycosyltransferase family 2 protein n=1 Tax=Kaistella carnis TaxID=1241979 RepID=UPI0028B01BF3|nr:glycosyltransferase family 2 protein [Kaistella carnis]
MKKLTIFTPTYNRANLLPRIYKSLCRQTSQDFLWLVIDDGSSDGTEHLIQKWQSENEIEIHYHYKKNGGMHTGHNAAYELIETELNVCIDSDDYMPEDAVEKILTTWDKVEDKTEYAGIIGLDANQDGEIIGTAIPSNLLKGTLHELYLEHKVTGDKKVILRTDIVKKYPAYPEYENEKLVPLGILYLMIGQDYDLLYSNDIFCIVEYQPDGSSNSIFKQYRQSPRGFAYSRKIQIKYSNKLTDQFKNYMHLISSSIFAGDLSLAFKGVNPVKSLAIYPFGLLMNLYIKSKIKG